MKFSIQKTALKEALSVLASCVKKQPGAITSNILFQLEGDRLVLKASDHFVYTHLVLTAEEGLEGLEGTGAFAIEEARLSKWVSNLIEDLVTVEFNEETEEATFTCGSVTSPFPSKEAAGFPSKNFDEAYANAEILSDVSVSTLLQSLTFVRGFVSTSTSNSDPSGRLQIAQLRGDQLLGTDAKLLGMFKCANFDAEWKIGVSQIPAALSYLKRPEPDTTIRILATDIYYFFESANKSYFGFAKQRNDLPVLSGIPTDLVEDEVFSVDKDHFKQAIGALKATSDPENTVIEVHLSGEGATASLGLKMATFSGRKSASVDIACTRAKGVEPLDFTASHVLLERSLSCYKDDVTMAYNSKDKYLKFYEKSASGDVKICLMTLREGVA